MDQDGEHAWEHSKENIQPLRTGRKVKELQKDATTLQDESQEYEMKLRSTKGEEQLETWYRYICWREQNFKRYEKETQNLLKNCLVQYQNKKEFYQNELYVELWIKMTFQIQEPSEVFKYMFDNEIGTSLAKFYKAWADHLEMMASIKSADEIYLLGVNRNAEPLDWLKNCKSEFEYRVSRKGATEAVDESQKVEGRKILGALKSGKTGKVGNDRTKITSSERPRACSIEEGKSTTKQHNSNKQFQIYTDKNNPGNFLEPTGQMKDPLNAKKHVENTMAMQMLKGAKLQNTGSVSGTIAKFEIFNDEGSEDTPVRATPKQVVVSARKPLSSKKREERDDEFYNKDQKSDPHVVVRYCKHRIYMGNKEVSFEELKAQLPKYSVRNIHVSGDVQNENYSSVRSSLAFDNIVVTTEDSTTNRDPIPDVSSDGEREENVFKDGKLRDHVDSGKSVSSNKFQNDENDITALLSEFNLDDVPGNPIYESTSVFRLHNENTGSKENTVADHGDIQTGKEEYFEAKRSHGHFELPKPNKDIPDDLDKTSCINMSKQCHQQLNNFDVLADLENTRCDRKVALPESNIDIFENLEKTSCFNMSKNPHKHPSVTLQEQRHPMNEQSQQQKGFEIYKDDQPPEKFETHGKGFQIFRDEHSNKQTAPTSNEKGFQIFHDEQLNRQSNKIDGTNQLQKSNPDPLDVLPSPTVNSKKEIEKKIKSLFAETLDSENFNLTFDDIGTTFLTKNCKFQSEDGDSKGFQIFQDKQSSKVGLLNRKSPSIGSHVFQDEQHNDTSNKGEGGFKIFQENEFSKDKKPAFQIFNDDLKEEKPKAAAFKIFHDENEEVSQHTTQNAAFIRPTPSFKEYRETNMLYESQASELDYENNKSNLLQSSDFFYLDEVTSSHDQISASERPISTPAAPSSIASITFGGNVSAVVTNMSAHGGHFSVLDGLALFNGSENVSQLGICSLQNLSTIQEVSGESDRSRKDSENEATEVHNNFLNPFDDILLEKLSERVLGEVSSLTDYFITVNGPLPKLTGEALEIRLGPQSFRIIKKLDSDPVKTIYKALNLKNKKYVSLLISKLTNFPSLIWNFYIQCMIHQRLNFMNVSDDFRKLFIQPDYVYKFSDTVCFESDLYSEGSLLGLINLYKKHKQFIDEALVLLYAYEIILIVHTLHNIKIVHGDLHPSKFLLNDCELTEEGPLKVRPLALADFNRSIDLNMFPKHIQFVGSNESDSFECPAMKIKKQWKYEADYYAAAATIHMLVFQNCLNTYSDPKTKKLKMCNVPRRDWNEELWSHLFFTLINTTDSCEDLLSMLEEELIKPQTIEKLEEAITNKNDLLMNDD